jgi:hypothetical protein
MREKCNRFTVPLFSRNVRFQANASVMFYLVRCRDMALAERHSYWPDGWGLEPGDAKGAMGATVNAQDGLKCRCKPRSDYPTSNTAPNAP